jgi:formamidopyrimidine-DNA glycosylase
MIELPEALTIARQMNDDLRGRRIKSASRGNAPHKFAFYSGPPDEYAAILKGKAIGEASEHGSAILISVEPGYVLVLGIGGERILLHQDADTLPKKHQLLLEFSDGAFLTVTIQGWGAALLLHESEVAGNDLVGPTLTSPIGDDFTADYFLGLFSELDEDDSRSIKYFVISKPGIWGVGNGYLQDILFRAKLHPRKRAVELNRRQQRALLSATKKVLKEAVRLGGRDTERDLYNRPGGYTRILHSKVVGKPCPECGAPIEKIQFLGGASYFCAACQAL